MTQYIADEAHFKEVIARVANVKKRLWIGTADIKDLYVGERPFLGVLAELISKGREVRLIHAKEPGPKTSNSPISARQTLPALAWE